MADQNTRIKSQISGQFLNDFATQSLFLAALIDPSEGRFNQETLKDGLKILINTLSCVRRFDPAFAQDKQFVDLDLAIGILQDKLPNSASKILKRAANMAKSISKRVTNAQAT